MLRDQQTAAMVKVMELSHVLQWCNSTGADSSLLHLYQNRGDLKYRCQNQKTASCC